MPLYLGHNLVSGQTRPVEAELREGSRNLATIEAIRKYIAQKISEIPTPDVSGQIEQHNVDGEAHLDIRAAITLAKTETEQYISKQIEAIPTPDVSGQISEHNTSEEAHADIRQLIDTKIAAIPTPNVSGQISAHNTDTSAHTDIREEIGTWALAVGNLQAGVNETWAVAKTAMQQVFSVGSSAPNDTKLLWIDTNSSTGGLKYYNGSAWVHVPVAYT